MTFLCPGLPRSFTCSQSSISSRLPPPTLSHTSFVPSPVPGSVPSYLATFSGQPLLSCSYPLGIHTKRTQRSWSCSQEELLVQSWGGWPWGDWNHPRPPQGRGLSSAGEEEEDVRSQLCGQESTQTLAILLQSSTVGLTVVPCLLVCRDCIDWRSLLISSLCCN